MPIEPKDSTERGGRMARRNPQTQSKHDRKVKQIAQEYKKKGWKVKADLPGYEKPDPIGKKRRIPDVVATKAGAERIIEVETKETIARDKDQQATFRRRAGQKPRTTFRIEEA